MSFRKDNDDFEAWLADHCDVVEEDIDYKHRQMEESAFIFLRATYFRWARKIEKWCPELMDAPQVLSVGDLHAENFGTWRDEDGRLVWGVNDFDEAAEMPYALDLIRLTTSALVAGKGGGAAVDAVCDAVLSGYREGLRKPQPVVLDRDRRWLRELVVVPEKRRAKFWKKIQAMKVERAPPRYRKLLAAAMPEPRLVLAKTGRRVAGAGSLGRPRWIGMANWRGAPVLREAKSLVPSAWLFAHGRTTKRSRCGEIAGGRYRAIDPWHLVTDAVAVRRLSPNNRKIEAGEDPGLLLSPDMLRVMGADLAAVHLGVSDRRAGIERDLRGRKRGWLKACAVKMAQAVQADFADWAGAGASAKSSRPRSSRSRSTRKRRAR